MKTFLSLMMCAMATLPALAAQAVDPINFGWRFAKGSHPDAVQPAFDDSAWSVVDLPHDWAIAGPFDPAGDPDTGKLPWKGEGWYRKRFTLPEAAKGKRVQLVFDGVMASPVVYLNGVQVGSWIYGYNSFWLDATKAAAFGGENVLTVHADTREHASRWYPGAGIYRKVTLRLVDPVHIPVWGVYVTTPSVEDAAAKVHAEIDLANTTGRAAAVVVEAAILAPDGRVVATERKDLKIAGEADKARFDFVVANPQRWDITHPHLYTLRARALVDGRPTDNANTTFGIRTFKWTANDGFFLNGRSVDLQGVCEHDTYGLLGAAFFPRAMERKLEILRDMGVNALRTSHNPTAPEVVEMCDRLGIVVIDELYDKWGSTAGKRVTTAEYIDRYAEAEIRNFVLRDRNSPSVMIWSIANEEGAILSNRDGHSAEHVAKAVGYFKQYDASRPTLMVAHLPQGADRDKHIFDAVDVSGWNYSARYTNFRKNYPEKPIIYSETASAFGTRGYYSLKLPETKTDYQPGPYQSDYGLTAAIWADIPEHEFERMRKEKFLNGNFAWTGFDYLGEPTPARGQKEGAELQDSARSSYFGIIDLAGLPKNAFYLYRSLWQKDDHTVHISPHWNWSNGDRVPVIIYTDGDEAELFLNGRSLGRKAKIDPDSIRPANFAFGRKVNATSSEVIQDAGGNVIVDRTPDKAIDSNPQTRWAAENKNFPQVWEVDLGEARRCSRVVIGWDSTAPENEFELLASADGETWTTIAGQRSYVREQQTIAFEPAQFRYFKVRVLGHRRGLAASIREFEVLDRESRSQDPYFDIVDAYRIRFPAVPYEPGELKTVAYKKGKKIGEASVRTAGAPAVLELKADRKELKADGMDLCYVTIRLLDAGGNLCPLGMNTLKFSVTGAGTFVGADNGDQMGLDSFTDDKHTLFYGQAVAVLRSKPGASGLATLKVTSDNGVESEVQVRFAGSP
jgi:beta-galactosidase